MLAAVNLLQDPDSDHKPVMTPEADVHKWMRGHALLVQYVGLITKQAGPADFAKAQVRHLRASSCALL